MGNPQDSFLSLWEAPHSEAVSLETFSLRNGAPLGTLVTFAGPRRLESGPSTPEPAAGSLWFTLSRGPFYQNDTNGGDPKPDSCASEVVRLDPSNREQTTVLRFPSSALTDGVAPSPNGRVLMLSTGGCATSYFNQHFLVVNDRTGRRFAIGAHLTPCHELGPPAWNAGGTDVVFPYGPSRLSPGTHFVPDGTCASHLASGIAVVRVRPGARIDARRLIAPPKGCSFQSAVFDRSGIAAVEGCERHAFGEPEGSYDSGPAYLVQLNQRKKVVLRLPLRPGSDTTSLQADPRTGVVLVSEQEAQRGAKEGLDWVWQYSGRRLRFVKAYSGGDTQVTAVPW